MIDHDRLFKELLTTFFGEFLALFFPQVMEYLDPTSLTALDKELFTDVTAGERYETDILMQARFRDAPAYFIIHLENQSKSESRFGKRMFRYFARLHEKYDVPIYPIVVFSYDKPQRADTNTYRVAFADKVVLDFNYEVIQLNRLDWRSFLQQPNPVASALMAKMNIEPADRPRVKLECLRMLVGLGLNPAKTYLISGFIDVYLKLNEAEEQTFQADLAQVVPPQQREEVMEIVTSWMEQGIVKGKEQGRAEGKEQGRVEGERKIVLKLLRKRVPELDESVEIRINRLPEAELDALSEALLDFTGKADLEAWLSQNATQV